MESRDQIGLGFFYVIHPCRTRSFLQPRSQSGQLLARSHGQHFDAPIVIITDPSGNLQDMRLALHKPAEADALHTSAHEKTAALNRGSFRGSHRGIAEVRG